MGGQVLVGGINVRAVTTGLADPTFEIIRDQDFAHPSEEGEGPKVGADPIRQLLCPGGLGIGIAAGPQNGQEDLGLPDLPGGRVDHRDRLPGIIEKGFLSGPMVLAHDQVEFPGPLVVVLAEPTILKAVRVDLPMFLPEEKQGHPFASEFLMDLRPVGLGAQGQGHER